MGGRIVSGIGFDGRLPRRAGQSRSRFDGLHLDCRIGVILTDLDQAVQDQRRRSSIVEGPAGRTSENADLRYRGPVVVLELVDTMASHSQSQTRRLTCKDCLILSSLYPSLWTLAPASYAHPSLV